VITASRVDYVTALRSSPAISCSFYFIRKLPTTIRLLLFL
jgi:hypothetical protein